MTERIAMPAPGVTLVRLLARLGPLVRRDEWLAEWEGELEHAWLEARRRDDASWTRRLSLQLRAGGAVADALWLRRRYGGDDVLGLDLKYAVRSLRRRPGFASVVVLTLALGIGATTAVFSVVNGVLLRPLPFPDPDRIVRLDGYPTNGDWEKVGTGTSYPDYLDVRAASTSFEHLAAIRGWTATLTAPGAEPQRVAVGYITANFTAAFGVRPILGRGFLPDDERPGATPVAMLSHELWSARWGGDASLVGGTIEIDGVPTTVVGILPADLRLRGDVQLWQPLVPGPLEEARGAHRLAVVGRLRDGTALDAARAEVAAIAKRLEMQYPQDNLHRGARLDPLRESIVADARPALLVLFGAVALVLLIGCTNLASLFLARATAREREMAVRAALGAGRGRLVRQWMTESLLLTTLGGLAGLAVAWGGMRALLSFVPRSLPRADEVALDLPVLAFLLVVSVATGLLFGILPALQQRREEASLASLRDGARGATSGAARRRLRQGLVVAEVALATVLVVGAALLIKSFWQLQTTELPFRPDGVVVTQVQLPATRYERAPSVLAFYERLHEELAAIPGVRDVSFAYEHPLSPGWTSSFAIVGREPPAPGTEPESRVRAVWPGYFRTVGLPILRGRDVSPRDRWDTPGVVVVNEAFVRRHFPDGEAIGATLDRGQSWWDGQPTAFEIVGVVADEPFLGLGQPAEPATYYPHLQFPFNEMWVVARTDGDVASVAPAIRDRIWAVDASLPIEPIRTMDEVLGATVAAPRFNAALLSVFALAALLLAAVGIYGVLSYTVAQRTGEIGIRIALGAERGRVVRQVVAQGLAGALAGIVVGVLGAIAVSRLLASLLVGVEARDPAVLGIVAGTLALVALAAAWLPARRASRIEPVAALRYD
ncbi:MAG TPA: ABC transporter permease [Gemmatimonadaceae bacterium]